MRRHILAVPLLFLDCEPPNDQVGSHIVLSLRFGSFSVVASSGTLRCVDRQPVSQLEPVSQPAGEPLGGVCVHVILVTIIIIRGWWLDGRDGCFTRVHSFSSRPDARQLLETTTATSPACLTVNACLAVNIHLLCTQWTTAAAAGNGGGGRCWNSSWSFVRSVVRQQQKKKGYL